MHLKNALSLAGGPLLALLCGCASIPEGRAAVDSLHVVGAHELAEADIVDKIATEDSPKFLGLLRGVAYDYSIYDPAVLQHDLARVERYYRGRGFFEAHVRVGRVRYVGSDHVRIEIVVDEGPPMLNRQVRVDGLAALPANIADAVRVASAAALPAKARFDEDSYAKARETLARALTDRGYAYAKVTADSRADLGSHSVDYVLTVSPGIATVFGAITFVGLDPDGAGPAPQEIEEGPLRRAIHIREGSPYSTAKIESATQALLDLEVFSAAHIVPGLSDPPTPVVPLVVQVEPTKLRAIRLGGGVEFDSIKADVHLIGSWEDHNLLGGLRDFSVALKPGLDLYPTSATAAGLVFPTHIFPEEHLRVQLRQPSFVEARTTGFVRPELNVYPLLLPPPSAKDANGQPLSTEALRALIESEPVVGYIEPKAAIGVDRRFGKALFVTLAYNVQGEIPISYKDALDSTLPTALLSFPQLTAALDFRDDPIHPHQGVAANFDLQVAGGPTDQWARDVRIQPDVEGYIPIARGVTFAVGISLGMLFPFNYGRYVESLGPSATPPSNTDIQNVYFRGFFSGGPSSNRGYPLRGVAPYGNVPFLNPQTARLQIQQNCNPKDPTTYDPTKCASPIGGFTLWEVSAELRLAISGPLGAAIFCDSGDVSQTVFPKSGALRFNYPHLSCGVGGRYDTPVGPIRIDIGYRVQPLQILGYADETKAQAADATYRPPSPILGLPIAIAFGIGEAF
jgi:outer membrane protein insertion porin family/translocation and assembly module TamA